MGHLGLAPKEFPGNSINRSLEMLRGGSLLRGLQGTPHIQRTPGLLKDLRRGMDKDQTVEPVGTNEEDIDEGLFYPTPQEMKVGDPEQEK